VKRRTIVFLVWSFAGIGGLGVAVAKANRAPVANAGADQVTQTLITLTFSGSASYDPDGTIAGYAWSFGDGTTGTGVTTTHWYATAGTYTVRLTVTDNLGATASDTALVTVYNRAPYPNAGPDQSTTVGTSVTLDGSRSFDADGTITSWAWTFGDGGSATTAVATHAYAAAGTYTATLTTTDNLGARASDSAVITVASAPSSATWSHAIGSVGSDGAYAVAVDAGGNTFVGGVFVGTMTVGTKVLVSAGGTDWFIVKYSPTGAVLWAQRWGGAGYDDLSGLAVDRATGDVLATGDFAGSASLGGATFVSKGGQDIGVARYAAATGAHVWSKQFGGTQDDAGNAVAVDGGGNVLVTGYFRGKSIPFGTTLLSDANGSDGNVFVTKLTSAGVPVWAKNFPGNTGENFGTSVATDAGGNVAFGGFFGNLLTITGTGFFASNAQYDGFVAELNAAGAPLWSRRIGRGSPIDGDDRVTGVAADAGGNVLVTGQTSGAVDYGAGAVASFGGLDTFVAKYTPSGAYSWARHLGGVGDDIGYGVAVDASNDVLVTGSFSYGAAFNGVSLTSRGYSDVFAAKLTAAGATLWARDMGGAGADTGCAIAAGPGGYPSVVGYFPSTGVFGGGTLVSLGLYDGFVARLAP
jgi:PKD repeat protein